MAGCTVYYPHTTLQAGAICGTVVDASSDAPIAGAKISRAQHPEAMCESDANGRFTLKKLHNLHYAVTYGFETVSDVPAGENWFETSVTVSQTNYLECTVDLATNYGHTIFLKKTADVPDPARVWLTFNGSGAIQQDMGAAGYLKPDSIHIIERYALGEPSRIRIKFVRRVYNPCVTALDQPDMPTLSPIHEWGFVWDFDIQYNDSGAKRPEDLSRIYKLEFVPKEGSP